MLQAVPADRAMYMPDASDIIRRIERLPPTRWHLKIRAIIGTATFFDGFDAVAIAFVLPTLIGLWHLGPSEIGFLLSSGFFGQLIGASAFGWLAERYGRIRVLNWTILILSLFGLVCAFAWSYWSLVVFRFLQGLGLGGEIPVAATFISEIARSKSRGRFVLLYQILLPIGFMAASISSIVIVPNLGWQWMFIVGAVPAVLTIFLRRLVPESPRWLAKQGRVAEADAIMNRIETIVERESGRPLPAMSVKVTKEVPHSGSWTMLFEGIYLRRTLTIWLMWFCAASIGYGLLVWLPTILRTVYKMSIQDALLYSSISNICVIVTAVCGAFLVDRFGRRPVFVVSFLGASVPLLVLWWMGAGVTATAVVVVAASASAMISLVQLGLWTYTPELYPTTARSFGSGTASAWARAASIIAPNAVGFLLARSSMSAVFLMFAIMGLIGVIGVLLCRVETRGRLLEEVSP
jgi:MFS transporter, putative metabolite:H+ symporter